MNSEVLCVTAELYIRTTASHVGGDGNGALLACLSNYLSLALVVLCVEHLVLDTARLEQLGNQLGLLDRDSTYQHRLPLLVACFDLVADRLELSALVLVDLIVVVDTDNRLVGRDLDNVQTVDLAELGFLGHSCTGHTGQLVVQAEEVLECDGGEGLALAVYLYAFLRLDSLVQTVVVAASEHQTAGEFVNDNDLAVLDNIVDIKLHDTVCTDSLVDVVEQSGVLRIHQVLNAEVLLSLCNAVGKQVAGLCLLVDKVIAVELCFVVLLVVKLCYLVHGEGLGEFVSLFVEVCGLVAAAGNYQRSSRLVNEYGVHLVDDGEVRFALYLVLLVHAHVVAQVVEAQLVVGCICDIACVSGAAGVVVHIVGDKSDGKTEVSVYLCHQLAVALCEVVVDGYDVNALACQTVQVGRQSGNEGLTFTGLHLGDTSLMEHDTAYDLYGVVAYADNSCGSLAADRESVRQDIVEGLAGCEPVL